MRSRSLVAQEEGLSFSVNQDCSCIAVGTLHGIRIFNVDQGRVLFEENCGAVRIVEMLFCTSLLAYVGAGEQPQLSPRRLFLINTDDRSIIKSSMYRDSITAVKMNNRRLVVLLRTQAVVYELENLQKLRVIEIPNNPRGVCAMSTDDIPSYLALPSSPDTGSIRLFDLLTDGGNLLLEIDAHKSPLSILKFNSDSTMLATASERGTLINVFSIPDGEKIYVLRRGSVQASILSLAFTPEECNPRLLAAVGSHGTVHVFKLMTTHLTKTVMSQVASRAAGMLTAVTSLPFDNLVEAARSCVCISIPDVMFQTCCFSSLLPRDNEYRSSDKAVLYIGSSSGKLYEYELSGLLTDNDVRACRKCEHSMIVPQ